MDTNEHVSIHFLLLIVSIGDVEPIVVVLREQHYSKNIIQFIYKEFQVSFCNDTLGQYISIFHLKPIITSQALISAAQCR